MLSKEKGREEGGEVRGGAIGVNPIPELFPEVILPEGLLHVKPGESLVAIPEPSLGEVKGES